MIDSPHFPEEKLEDERDEILLCSEFPEQRSLWLDYRPIENTDAFYSHVPLSD